MADVVASVHQAADRVPGLQMTYAPEHLRFFQARFRPLIPFPQIEPSTGELTLVPA